MQADWRVMKKVHNVRRTDLKYLFEGAPSESALDSDIE